MNLTVIVWAAGQTPVIGSDLPPALLPLAGRPALQYTLEAVRALKPAGVIVVVGDEPTHQAIGDGATHVIHADQSDTVSVWQQVKSSAAGRAETILLLPGDAPLFQTETLCEMVEAHWAREATVTRLGLRDGILCFRAAWLWSSLALPQDQDVDPFQPAGLAALASEQGETVITSDPADPLEAISLDNWANLARAEAEMRRRINLGWMLAGVSLIHPETTYIEADVKIGAGTVVWPNTLLQGQTRIGQGCTIGPGSVIRDSTIDDGCRVELSVVEQAIMEKGSDVGPFGHLRKGAHLGPGAHMGNFGEVKNSYLGPGAKMGHFSYMGDATVGAGANIGAGTITCNYDGQRKHSTTIGEEAFVGSGTMLVAPLELGDEAKTGAGSVVTHDVPAGGVAYGVPARLKDPQGTKESEAE